MLKPWVGSDYKNSIFGISILIFGESHYQWEQQGRIQTATPIRVVRDWKRGCYGKSKFASKLEKAFWGGILNAEERELFWDSVAFTNYIQEPVGIGAKNRPTKQMWREGESAFKEVVSELKPDCIIVASWTAWNYWLPSIGRRGIWLRVPKKRHETWMYPTSRSKCALATWIAHPSRRDFRFLEWHPVIQSAIRAAKEYALKV